MNVKLFVDLMRNFDDSLEVVVGDRRYGEELYKAERIMLECYDHDKNGHELYRVVIT